MNVIKSSEIIKYQFYSMPKELFSNKYKDLSLEAKMIYTLFIDRLELSKKNNWVNENGEVYLIFKRNDIGDILNITDKTVTKAIKELKDIKETKTTMYTTKRYRAFFIISRITRSRNLLQVRC